MNRKSIIKWLHTYSNLEQILKKYYVKYHVPIPENHFFTLIQEPNVSSDSLEFKNIDSSQIVLPPDFSDFLSHKIFSDNLWLCQNSNFSIRKHPRYFPELVHTHEFVEMAYVYEGSCTQNIRFSNGSTETITMPTGSLCILPPKLSHSVSVFDDSLIINILIRTSTIKNALNNLVVGNQELSHFFIRTLYENSEQTYLCFHTGSDEVLRDLLIDMLLEACEDKVYSQNVLFLQTGLFFTYLQRNHSSSIQFSNNSASGIQYVPQILDELHKNYATTNAELLSQKFYLSKSYISRIFKANTNMTIVEALQKIRIQNAQYMLINSHLSVQEICEHVGYSDVSFFIRLFKKHIGMTPLKYRSTHQL